MTTRIESIIERVERDEPISVDKELALMALDLARLGEEFAEEFLNRDRSQDEKFEHTTHAF